MDTDQQLKDICKTITENIRQAIGETRRVVGLPKQPSYSGNDIVTVEGKRVELRFHIHLVQPFLEFPPKDSITSAIGTAIAERIHQDCGEKTLVSAPLPRIVMSPPLFSKHEYNGLHLRTILYWDMVTLENKISVDVLLGILEE